MTTDTVNTKELFASLDNTIAELLTIISVVDEKDINTVPFENSWTAAQVVAHVTRSINGMGEALRMPGKTADRELDEKANGFKTMFLNFDSKMKSPPFVLPEQDVYEKDLLIKKLKSAEKKFTEAANSTNLSVLLDLPPIGQLTKLELLHFVLYHTQRHIHQLKNILEKINH